MNPFLRKYERDQSAFDFVAHADSPGGMPILSDALAWLDCRVTGEHEAGDHVVVFGEVEHAALLREGDPAIHLRRNGLAY
jgi:flavin reductase (DIM6/NTAB) family NADH-FMN oxidoreductase RutF